MNKPITIRVECPTCHRAREIETVEGDATRYSRCRKCKQEVLERDRQNPSSEKQK